MKSIFIYINVITLFYCIYNIFVQMNIYSNKEEMAVNNSRFIYNPKTKSPLDLRREKEYLPLVIIAPLSMKKELEDDLSESCDQWNRAAKKLIVTYAFEEYSHESFNGLKEENENRIFFTDDWRKISKEDKQLALSVYERTKNVITRGAIVINKRHNFHYKSEREKIKDYEFSMKAVLSHEIGHLLGMNHREDESSIIKNGRKTTTFKSVDIRPGILLNTLNS